MANSKTVIIKIKRQDNPDSKPYWEEFELPYRPGMNVTSSLMDIAANPVTKQGKATTPVTYDSNCLEEVCGSCAMLINGKARMACSALIDKLEQPVTARAVLQVSRRARSLGRSQRAVREPEEGEGVGPGGRHLRPWLGPAPDRRTSRKKHYPLSRCISCCCCMEACPQFNDKTGFVGAATISQVRLFNTHPTGKALKVDRLKALMGDGGIQECGYAQNCVEVCPKDIPLTKSIADVGGQVMWQAVKDLFRT